MCVCVCVHICTCVHPHTHKIEITTETVLKSVKCSALHTKMLNLIHKNTVSLLYMPNLNGSGGMLLLMIGSLNYFCKLKSINT